MAIIDNPGAGGGGGGSVDETSALKYMLEHKTNYTGIAAGLTSLTALPTFTQPSGISVFSNMFDGCTQLTTVPSLTLPSSGATYFDYMFRNCTALVSIPDISISSASSANGMFYGCSNMAGQFSSTSGSGNLSANGMFYNCKKITSATITGRGITDAANMFNGCTALQTVSLKRGGATSPYSLGAMFRGSGVTSVDITTVASYPDVMASSCASMFYGCTKLVSVDIHINGGSTTAINLKYADSCSAMFYECRKLTSPPMLTNSGNVRTFGQMFYGCTVMTDIPQLDMSTATSSNSLQNFVSGCPALTNTSLNNILASLLTWGGSANKTLKYIGLTSAQATTCTGLSNWSALSAAGWTTGY